MRYIKTIENTRSNEYFSIFTFLEVDYKSKDESYFINCNYNGEDIIININITYKEYDTHI